VLWYKAWLETRARFLTCLAAMVIFCAVFVHHAQGFIRPDWKNDHHNLMFATHQFVCLMWIMAVVLLGMGGLLREKSLGTSSLTLAFPISRAHWMGVRVGMGVLESIALGVVPWVVIFLVSFFAGMPILIAQVGFYVLLLTGGGLVYFAIAVLVSSLVEGEYTAPALAYGLVFLTTVVLDAWLRRFNLWRLVSGDYYIDRKTYLLSGHPPLMGLLASLFVAVLLLLVSVRVIQRREF